MIVKAFKWMDRTGFEHIIPDKTCVICSHCTDIFLDPLKCNEIYCCVCELKEDADPRSCKDFEYDKGYESKEPFDMEVKEWMIQYLQ